MPLAQRSVHIIKAGHFSCRFTGEEQLPCFCGAAACRGWVNSLAAADLSEAMLVPKSELEDGSDMRGNSSEEAL